MATYHNKPLRPTTLSTPLTKGWPRVATVWHAQSRWFRRVEIRWGSQVNLGLTFMVILAQRDQTTSAPRIALNQSRPRNVYLNDSRRVESRALRHAIA